MTCTPKCSSLCAILFSNSVWPEWSSRTSFSIPPSSPFPAANSCLPGAALRLFPWRFIPPLSRPLRMNSRRRSFSSMACSMSSSAACLSGWSPSAWAMAGTLCWATSWVWTCIPSLAVVSNCWIKMWSAAAPAARALVVRRREKNARHNRGPPLPARTRYRGRSHDWLTMVSPNTVARLLHGMGYSLRVNQKQISTSSSPNRNLQFEYLAELRYRFQRRHLPIVSVDSKKRELVGNFKNPGRRWESAPRCVYDHDFRTDSIGVAIPYGIYDVMENRGALVVGVSHDTPAFAAHAIAHWWRQEGSTRYSGSRQLLILADPGGSNSCRCHAWKTELQFQLANSFALAVTVAHYPTGASKWNPIEHRLFSEVSRNWAGEPLDSYQKILNYARTTQTQTGLQVTAYLDRRLYPCGLKPTPDQMASLRLQRHETLPEWNYTIKPQL